MVRFDILMLLLVSALLMDKSFYLGSVTLMIGLLIHFQCARVRSLLGKEIVQFPLARKIKAAILAAILGLSLSPLLFEGAKLEKEMNKLNFLPLIITISLFSTTMMAALVVERRRR